jgi:membrane-bound serine protease (ClpP class)
MTDIGLALVLVGAALLVVEAHVAGGVIGVFGGMALAAGAALVIGGAGGGIALVVAAMVAAVAVTGAWLAVAARKSLLARRRSIASGTEALSGRTGVVRSWNGQGGQVFVDGALWRARLSPIDEDDRLHAGDAIVVERVSGLTLAVRKAEEWEESW